MASLLKTANEAAKTISDAMTAHYGEAYRVTARIVGDSVRLEDEGGWESDDLDDADAIGQVVAWYVGSASSIDIFA